MTVAAAAAALPLLAETVVHLRRGPDRTWLHVLLGALVVLLAVLGWLAMRRGWRRRAARQGVLAAPPAPPRDVGSALLPPLDGLYVGTTTADDWLDRVVVHGLGQRATGRMDITEEGVLVTRNGSTPVWLPAAALRDARVDAGLAGKVVGPHGLLVLRWALSSGEGTDTLVETGFRAREHARQPAAARAVRSLVEREPAYAGGAAAAPAGSGPAPVAGPPPVAEPFLPAVVPAARPAVPAPARVAVPEPPTRAGGAATPPAEPRYDPLDPSVTSVERLLDQGRRLDAAALDPGRRSAPAAPPAVAPGPGGAALVRGLRPPALLVLEDGRTFAGDAYGAVGRTTGEAVFATGMTGYQETLTDPSFHRQVVTMTAPHIGNTGVNDTDPESGRIWVAGFVVRDPSRISSNHRSQRDLDAELAGQGVVGISGVDTRALTRHLRERGPMRCAVDSTGADRDDVLAAVLASPVMDGSDLAAEVSTREPYVVPPVGERRYRVAALDLGIKRSTPASLARAGVEVHVLPSWSGTADLLALQPDGVFLSNGPGDPAVADVAVETARGVVAAGVPLFGICFGNQVLGRALGFGTYKLAYGHRGVNQPVQDRATGRVAVTSHNHGYAVDAPLDGVTDTPLGRVEVSHVGLNDQVVEGLRCLDARAFSVQYHPEAAPGPHDASGLFAAFTRLMDGGRP